jgi:heme exporter protein B
VLAPISLEGVAVAKIVAHWLTTGLPLTILAPLLAVLFDLTPGAAYALIASLALGTPALSAVGAVGAALTLSIRRGGLILAAIVLPLIVPALIFGAAAVLSGGEGGYAALLLLAAYSVFTLALAPFAAAAAIRLHLGS